MRRSSSSTQLNLFSPESESTKKIGIIKPDTSTTFANNVSLPIHRWFRYSAGFSAAWVRELLDEQKTAGRTAVVDPFAGSGTVLLEAEMAGIASAGIEAHPFVVRVAQAKLHWRQNPPQFREFAFALLEQARTHPGDTSDYPSLITKCFPDHVLAQLDSLRRAWQAVNDNSALSSLTWLALVSILRECSPVGTAQWQYILPNKTKARVTDPYSAFSTKVSSMVEDMSYCQRHTHEGEAHLYQEDARSLQSIPNDWADLIITSPPYANNFDYADATRLEMSFMGEVNGWGDIHKAVRQHLICSCTQHVPYVGKVSGLLQDKNLDPIRAAITSVCEQLGSEKETHGGKKAYDGMIAAYFSDMAMVWHALRRICRPDALVCFVIGDSAPYGVYVPVDQWLGELAIASGFKSYTFEKTRDRNIKWKNRKHQVPLHEGRLWVQG